jgi:ubiquitin-like modifier-activating enzyme ATG7
MDDGWIVKFVPFNSAVASPFWVAYCREKLERIHLSTDPIEIRAQYGVEASVRMQLEENSLMCCGSFPDDRVSVKGMLVGCNTLEDFQKIDKNELLYSHFGDHFLEGNLSCLTRVLLLTFADLKNHKVLYWFGFPALMTRPGKSIRAVRQDLLEDIWSSNRIAALDESVTRMRHTRSSSGQESTLPPYFIITDDECLPLSVKDYERISEVGSELVFGYFDPSGPSAVRPEQPMGWPLRNLVAFLSFHLKLGGTKVKVISYRPKQLRRIETVDSGRYPSADGSESVLLQLSIPMKTAYDWNEDSKISDAPTYKVVGWELNTRAKPGPRWVNLRPLLDSRHLAVQAADLNLKLMKWRMLPDLQVEKLQKTKVLIIGAGTLGCTVARVLLGWGVRNFTFVDYGKVSYSNPVRQSLFTLDDCHADGGGGRPKAEAAAEALKEIAADVQSKGVTLSIPMPGHIETREAIETSVNALDQLMQPCDVAFLLTDTRESRWLPTLMAATYGKTMINAALGLDSWLVMRHGGGLLERRRFGCYFCNDVVAPENSMKNRTVDQQCTVTRPGLAPIASSMAVELMVSLLHHADGLSAPAPAVGTSNFMPTVSQNESGSPLGVIPQQIRGSLVTYTMMTPTVPAFCHCTACSAGVVDSYLHDKVELVFQTCQSSGGSFLAGISGLTAFRADAAEKFDESGAWDDDHEDEV